MGRTYCQFVRYLLAKRQEDRPKDTEECGLYKFLREVELRQYIL